MLGKLLCSFGLHRRVYSETLLDAWICARPGCTAGRVG
jgi:hypothetical protein